MIIGTSYFWEQVSRRKLKQAKYTWGTLEIEENAKRRQRIEETFKSNQITLERSSKQAEEYLKNLLEQAKEHLRRLIKQAKKYFRNPLQ